MRNRRRLERDEIVRALGLHLQMLPAVVDVDVDARILEDVGIRVAEVPRGLEDLTRQIGDVHALDRRMQRRRVRRIAHAEPDDQHALGVRHRQQRNVHQRAHVPLVEQRGRRHRVAVGEESSSAARHFRHRDDIGDAFADGQQLL